MASFDPQKQFNAALVEMEQELVAARATLDRLLWLKGKVAEQLAEAERLSLSIETYTEAEAAEIFKLQKPGCRDPRQAEKLLASLRRKHKFPHLNLGGKIIYTRQHIAAISELMTVRSATVSRRDKAMLKAA